jgi:hypothetical protein
VRPSVLAVFMLMTNSTFTDRKIGGLFALEHSARVNTHQSMCIGERGPIAHQAASYDVPTRIVDSRKPM